MWAHSLRSRPAAAPDSLPPTACWAGMSQHILPPSQPRTPNPVLPRGRAKLLALELAVEPAAMIAQLVFPRGLSHLRDHLVRAADNTVLRLSEASGRTLGNRYQHLEAAHAENQEVQSDLLLLTAKGVKVPSQLLDRADRLGGRINGLLRAARCGGCGWTRTW